MSENTIPLQWPRNTEFVDYQTDQRFPGQGVYEIPAQWEALYRRRGWTDPPEDHEGDSEQPTSAINRNLDGPARDELEGADAASDDGDENADGGDDADEGGSGN